MPAWTGNSPALFERGESHGLIDSDLNEQLALIRSFDRLAQFCHIASVRAQVALEFAAEAVET